MHTDLQPFWERAESLKTDILAKADALSPSQQNTAPKPGEWSVAQVVSHLVIAEQFVTGYGAAHVETLPALANPLVIRLVCNALAAGIALPAPAITEPSPEPAPLPTLAREWQTERDKLQSLLNSAQPDTLYGVHPYFGTITVRQTVEMLAAHTAYHYKRFPRLAR